MAGIYIAMAKMKISLYLIEIYIPFSFEKFLKKKIDVNVNISKNTIMANRYL